MSAHSNNQLTMPKKDDKECVDIYEAIHKIEEMLEYKFTDKESIEMALTHPSYTHSISKSYQSLEFVGDSVLGSMIAGYSYVAYPGLHPYHLSLVKSANVSTENLARVAIRTGLYKYMRHNVPSIDEKVKEFVKAVNEEEDTITVVYGGAMKAPKILADIVEAIVGAVFVDLQLDSKETWKVVNRLFEPLITFDMIQQQPQPITKLYELCQKNGKQVEIKQWREGDKTFSSVYVENQLIVSVSSDTKENARIRAAMAALEELTHHNIKMDVYSSLFATSEIKTPKRKLNEISLKKNWSKPTYRIEKQEGPAHAKMYVCSVSLKVGNDLFYKEGEEKSRMKDAEGSAARAMLLHLRDRSYL